MRRLARHALAACAWMPMTVLAAGGVDPAKLCGDAALGAGVSPVALVYAALASAGSLQPGLFDADTDGNETAGERLEAIFSPRYCEQAGASKCGRGDQGRLHVALLHLRAFLETHIRIEAIAEPTPADIRDRPLLADDEYGAYVRALDERGRFARLACRARVDTPPQAGATPLRVSHSVDGLSLRRGSGELLAAVPQAEIAYADDKEAGKTTLDVAAVIGYDLSRNPLHRLVPYVEARHKRVSSDDTDTKKWGVGVLYGRLFESLDDVSVAAHYAIDKTTDAEFATLKAAWSPGFLLHIDALPFGGATRYGRVDLKLDARLQAEVGRVIEAGTSGLAEDDAEFLRIGPVVSTMLWLAPELGWLSRMSFDATYRNLAAIDGPGPLQRFSAGINYSPEKTDHYTVRFSYEHGREDDTLKRIRGWKLSLGIRY